MQLRILLCKSGNTLPLFIGIAMPSLMLFWAQMRTQEGSRIC